MASDKQYLITDNDLFLIISSAKSEYVNLPNEIILSGKKVDPSDFKHIALVKAVISCLNQKGMLNGDVDFDTSDPSSAFDSIEELS